jgi:hypothetical protein
VFFLKKIKNKKIKIKIIIVSIIIFLSDKISFLHPVTCRIKPSRFTLPRMVSKSDIFVINFPISFVFLLYNKISITVFYFCFSYVIHE